MKTTKKVSTKGKLSDAIKDLAIANDLQLKLQKKLYENKVSTQVLHESAIVGHYISICREKIDEIIKNIKTNAI
jgi:hypothetical protein